MLRSAFIVFLLGWVAWFLIDKPPDATQRLPEVTDSTVANFQTAFDMLKAGYPDIAYIYIWNAHYLLLSLLGGVLIALLVAAVSEALGRRRMRALLFPRRRSAPADEDRSSGDEPR